MIRFLTALAALLASVPASAQDLQWVFNSANGHWYGMPYSPTNWINAEALAVSQGGHLATIRSASENSFVMQNFSGFNYSYGYWLGLNDTATEGAFVWASGEPVSYTNWIPGQPDNSGDEDYVNLLPSSNGRWSDLPAVASTLTPLVELPATPGVGWTMPINYSTLSGPRFLAIGDVNHDGVVDAVVPNAGSGGLSIFLGQPGGTFSTPSTILTSANPVSVALGKFDGDDHVDIAVTCYSPARLDIRLGNGAGGFVAGTTIQLPGNAQGIAAADFDGDGLIDLAVTTVAGQQRLIIFRSLGNGSFAPPVYYGPGSNPIFVTAGDLDADGDVDLVVSNHDSNDISIFLNTGSGTFTTTAIMTRGTMPERAAIGDFDGDGDVDLAVPNFIPPSLHLLWGNGNGTFVSGPSLATGAGPSWASAADLDGNGHPDIIVTNSQQDSLSVFYCRGMGIIDPGVKLFLGAGPLGLAVADVTGDGHLDLVATANGSNRLVVLDRLLRDCNANNIEDPTDIELGTSADCNGNGIPDECDVAQPAGFDCDANGLVDSCEIAVNAGLDLDQDGSLDRCEVAGVAYCFGDGTGSACPCDPGQAGVPGHGCQNNSGTSGRLDAVGNPQVALDSVTLLATGLLPGAVGLFFQGNMQQNGGLGTSFGDGLLCVNQSVKRLVIRGAVGGAMSFGRNHPNDPPISVVGQITPAGGTRYYQVWYRDASAYCTPSTYNLSNGVQVVWLP